MRSTIVPCGPATSDQPSAALASANVASPGSIDWWYQSLWPLGSLSATALVSSQNPPSW